MAETPSVHRWTHMSWDPEKRRSVRPPPKPSGLQTDQGGDRGKTGRGALPSAAPLGWGRTGARWEERV